jgi:hypothetical protein
MTASDQPTSGPNPPHLHPIQTARFAGINMLTLRFADADLERAWSSSWCQKQALLDRCGLDEGVTWNTREYYHVGPL